MSEACTHCGLESCQPVYFHLCPGCQGDGCEDCKGSLVPGLMPGEIDPGDNIGVCSQFADPEVDAAIDDQRESLISAITECRDRIIEEMEDANEKI